MKCLDSQLNPKGLHLFISFVVVRSSNVQGTHSLSALAYYFSLREKAKKKTEGALGSLRHYDLLISNEDLWPFYSQIFSVR
jgi:hypothetical protein